MILKRQTNWIRAVMIIMALMASYKLQADSDFQAWIPININARLTKHLRGFLEFQPRIGDNASNLTTAIVRPSLGWALNGKATLWLGYMMQADSVAPDSGTYRIENRAWQGFTWRDTANDNQFIWEVRNRLEERFLPQNSDPSIRWRTRLRVEQLIPGWPTWSVIASEELFVNLNDNSNNVQLQAGVQQNRLYLGLGYRFAPEIQVETGYLYQYVWRNPPAADQHNNIWMTNLNLNF
jgi:Protein of unknown function (DUF2490)